MNKIQKAVVLLICILSVKANTTYGNVKISNEAKISILTCSAGDELYSAFGHSAIRIKDPAIRMDIVFNYGVFDFETPHFYLKFANGKLNYQMSGSKYNRFLYSYMNENRSVTEQTLNLNQNEKQILVDALFENYKPENRYYKYDFFYDNCATRVFHIIKNNIGGKLLYDDYINPHKTFRQYLHHYLENSQWIETGLKVILGMPADKEATLEQSTFLPDYLYLLLKSTKVDRNRDSAVFVGQEKVLLEKTNKKEVNSLNISPFIWFCFLLIIVASLPFVLKRKLFFVHVLYRVVLFTTGIVGLLILYLWFVTDHSVTGNNLNILWSFPAMLILSFIRWNNSKLMNYIVYLQLTLQVVFLLGWKLLPQNFPLASIPFSISLVFILSYIRFIYKKLY